MLSVVLGVKSWLLLLLLLLATNKGASLATKVPEGQGDKAALWKDQGSQPLLWPPLKAQLQLPIP